MINSLAEDSLLSVWSLLRRGTPRRPARSISGRHPVFLYVNNFCYNVPETYKRTDPDSVSTRPTRGFILSPTVRVQLPRYLACYNPTVAAYEVFLACGRFQKGRMHKYNLDAAMFIARNRITNWGRERSSGPHPPG